MEWNTLLQDLLYAVITAAVPVITMYIVKFLKTIFSKVKVETDQTIVKNTIDEALEIVMKVVISTSQTYVDSLKAEGKFDKEAQLVAFNNTKDTIKSLLSDEAKNLIATLYDDIDTWLTIQIESAVREQKLIIKKEGE